MAEKPGDPFITLDHITVRLRDKIVILDSSWQMRDNEQWAIMGPNGSGKTTLVRSLWGGAPLRSGSITHHFAGPRNGSDSSLFRESIGYVSFETHQSLLEREELAEEFRA
jgi:ABC-type molybdenum transport system ATPase subunit/photorepair protein PhrA